MENNTESNKYLNRGELGSLLGNILIAIFKGELLLRARVNRYFIHIIYTFILFFASIWLSMEIEKTLVRFEKNKVLLSLLEVEHSQKTVKIVSLNRITTIEKLLKEKKSTLRMGEKPASVISNN